MSEDHAVYLERVRAETRALLGDASADVDYITEEMVASDREQGDTPELSGGGSLGDLCYIINPRWGEVRTQGSTRSVYIFECGDDPSSEDSACTMMQRGWLIPENWDLRIWTSCGGDLRRKRYRGIRKVQS